GRRRQVRRGARHARAALPPGAARRVNPAGVAGARMLARYNAWANRLIYDAVAALPPGEAVKERTTLFKNMVHTLNHNHVIGLIWQAHLEGRAHGFSPRNTKDHPPLSDLRKAQEHVDRWYLDWTAALSDASLG